MLRARPKDRAVPPKPLATISHDARATRPQARPAAANPECWRFTGLRRCLGACPGSAGRELSRDRVRELASDLLVRPPDRATVLLGIAASLVSITSSRPPATLITAPSEHLGRVTAATPPI